MGLGIGLSILLQSLFYALFGLKITLIFNIITIGLIFFLLSYDYAVWELGWIGKKHASLLRKNARLRVITTDTPLAPRPGQTLLCLVYEPEKQIVIRGVA